jgi:osmotically-inducible protein OsmY
MNADHKLQKLVLEALDFDPDIDCSRIGVGVRGGIVTLSGHVGSNLEKRKAEITAGCVPGVRAVIDDVLVELPGRTQTEDEQIAEHCLEELSADQAISLDRIHISVADGIVTVHGDVDHEQERGRIDAILSKLSFVHRLVNELVVKPPVKAGFVREKVRQALQPISPINAEKVEVETMGTRVILKGAVNSWHERGLAESAARSVPGVTSLDNRIVVL